VIASLETKSEFLRFLHEVMNLLADEGYQSAKGRRQEACDEPFDLQR
jgi:hypothetical protein